MTAQALTALVDFVHAAKTEIADVDGAQLGAMRRERPDLLPADVRELPVVLYCTTGGWTAMWTPPCS